MNLQIKVASDSWNRYISKLTLRLILPILNGKEKTFEREKYWQIIVYKNRKKDDGKPLQMLRDHTFMELYLGVLRNNIYQFIILHQINHHSRVGKINKFLSQQKEIEFT